MLSDTDAKVSVIVPIMNVEKFLDQCLTSISEQTYKNLEIILINDGSTDGSLSIMQEHAAYDDRIRIIDKPNEGYGASCNRGIEEATGAWISVIEPDDWIEASMYEDMLAFAATFDERIDIIKTPWYDEYRWNDPKRHKRNHCYLHRRLASSKHPFTLAEHPVLIEGHPSIWTCLYHADFLRENSIRFIPYPGAGWADNPFLIETMIRADRIIYLDKAFYHYRTDIPGSTLHHSSDEAIQRPFERWIEMMDILDREGIDDLGVIRAHYFRGFKYVQGAIVDDGWDNPVVREHTRKLFNRMDPAIVAAHPKLDPKDKKFFFEVTETKPLHIPGLLYPKHVIREGVHSLKSSGVITTIVRMFRVVRRTMQDPTDPSRRREFKLEDID